VARSFPPGRGARTTRWVVGALLLTLAGAAFSPAVADRTDLLENREDRLGDQIPDARQDLDSSSRQLWRASQALTVAQARLDDARSVLFDLRGQLDAARALDEQMQARLAEAERELAVAEADLSEAEQVVDDQQDEIELFAVESYSNGDPGLVALGTVLGGDSPLELTETLSATDAVLAAQTGDLDQLDAARILLELRQERVEELRDAVAVRRQQAADNLDRVHELTLEARAQTDMVRGLVADRRAARQRAAQAKQHDDAVLARMERERDRVESMLAAIARRQARREARARATSSASSESSGGSGSSGSSSGGFLDYPIPGGYITSPYGMRMHPILHYYKLHDGTDFGVSCGTPVHAAAAGTVVSEYYNSGYGNRVIMNHGLVNGVSLSTSYNHLTSFVARPGEHVVRGEVIAYAGTTGYSTGCHLHFMVYVNGATVDPMSWL